MSGAAGQLIVEVDGVVVRTVALSASTLTIGRTPDSGLTLSHPSVSRHHAELQVTAGGVLLTDVGSSLGTVIDGQPLLPHQPRLLAGGETIAIGPYRLTYRPPVDAAAPAEPVSVVEPSPANPDGEPLVVAAPSPPPTPPVATPAPCLPAPPRQTWPAPPAPGPASRYLEHLPGIFQDGDFLRRLLLLFETIWEPLEQRQDHIAAYFDPRTCPAGFLPWLGGWMDLALDAGWPEARLRALVAEAMDLYRWRGTRYGLTRMIEVCTGLNALVQDDPEQPFVFRVHLAVPPGAEVDRGALEILIQTHKPAHTGYVLEVTA